MGWPPDFELPYSLGPRQRPTTKLSPNIPRDKIEYVEETDDHLIFWIHCFAWWPVQCQNQKTWLRWFWVRCKGDQVIYTEEAFTHDEFLVHKLSSDSMEKMDRK